jgi:putative transcriptional regulator
VRFFQVLPYHYTAMEKEVLLKNLGERIRKIREEKGITQKQLAHTINKDQQSIQRLEAGKINPSFYYLFEVARGLDISIEILLTQ